MNDVLNYVDERPTQAALPSELNAAAQAAMFRRGIEEVDYGMVWVDAGAAVRHANELAKCEMLGNGPIGYAQGRLLAQSPASRAALAQAIADAMRGRRRMLTLEHNGNAIVVSVIPVRADDPKAETLALVFFGKRPGHDPLTIDFYASHHGLTGAESTVLKLLWCGLEPKKIAERLRVAVSTVRSHISNIRTKTQTDSIRSLLNRLAALPPITSAVKGAMLH